ncbi:MAG: hypothetical protein JO321_11585 [Solirubrobacterales bacterium]|nr:hypothetical protein [Solirubrobacterales bacterium]
MSEADRARGRAGLTRRRFLIGASAVAAGGAAIGVGLERALGQNGKSLPAVALPAPAPGLPGSQHAWGATLSADRYGNTIAPRFDRLLLFDVNGNPTPGYARVLEAALRTLERAFPWSPSGLLFTAGWSPDYFERVLRVSSPIPRARRLSDFELPTIDTYDLCLHFASNDEQRLAAVEAALIHGAPLPGASGHLDISRVLTWRETRTGFTGAGLPAARQHVGGIPAGDPVPRSAPLFMGFKSNLKRNQASEDAVTIAAGPFAGGTTMHVSYMRLRLDSWYRNLSDRERVARMYAPQVTPREAAHFTTDAKSDPNLLDQAITRYGVVGHAQTSARARRAGKPLILRRDFNTVDSGQAGLHFVALQRAIEDFVTTRTAMNAASAQLRNPAITGTVNNGINEFMFVLKRANYILPPRSDRSFPLLPGRAGTLAE